MVGGDEETHTSSQKTYSRDSTYVEKYSLSLFIDVCYEVYANQNDRKVSWHRSTRLETEQGQEETWQKGTLFQGWKMFNSTSQKTEKIERGLKITRRDPPYNLVSHFSALFPKHQTLI